MEQFDHWPLLAGVSSPADVKAMTVAQTTALAEQIRAYLAFRVSENGGHLASNLGVVELTLALHRVFDAPKDHILFDVGHQSYVHKLITGRKERFDTLRSPGGISGFTKRAESVYDPFGAGHSSTAVSAAIGMAQAARACGSDAWTVAVVGDGALTGGLAYEGLNNCDSELRLILIINENEMSISPNTGRLAWHLAKIRSSHNYLKTKELTSGVLRRIPLLGRPAYKLLRWAKRRVKHVFYQENLFEHMGIRYVGPVDGNDLEGVEASLRHARNLGSSVILHIKTTKGKGYAPAECDPNAYHALPPKGKVQAGVHFSTVCGEELTLLANEDARLCAITAAMSCGTGLEPFRVAHPKRFYDVGIAEGHAVTFAAGLAAGGMRPVFAVYSTFLQRAYDNVLHDVALQRLPLVLCIDRAGLNGGDGPTHHGIFDVAMLSVLPDVCIYAPVSAQGLRRALRAALQQDRLCAIRYPNGAENSVLTKAFYPAGDGEDSIGVRVWGDDADTAQITLITHGRIAAVALEAAEHLRREGIAARVLLCEYLAPYGRLANEIAPLLAGHAVLFLEEEIRCGGFGMNLRDALERLGVMRNAKSAVLGTENGFAAPGEGQSIWQAAGVDVPAVLTAAHDLLEKNDQ